MKHDSSRQPTASANKRKLPRRSPRKNAPSSSAPEGLLDHQQVQRCAPGTLLAAQVNPRTHSPKQVQQIAASIKTFGFINPILVDADNRIIAGHGRLAAAEFLKLATVPTLRVDHLTPEQQRAYLLADNRLAELAGWDHTLLATELLDLSTLELNFELPVIGFSTGEIDVLINELNFSNDAAVDEEPIPESSGPPVTEIGDLWQVGPHRLLCADATKPESYTHLLGDQRAQLVFTDPPYNVPIAGHVSGLGKAQHAEFAMGVGEMSQSGFTEFLNSVFGLLVKHSQDGSIHFVCMDWRHMTEMLAAGDAVYSELKNLCVWAKTNGGMGSLYRSQHELVFVFKAGRAPHINNVELGVHGRYRTNVWSYAGVNTFGSNRDAELAWHPTVKPLPLVADAIQDCSDRGGIVLDPFAGSGTTLVAAAQTGRHGYGLELEPRYCDIVLQRLMAKTGEVAVQVVTGQTWAERNKAEAA